MLMRKCNLLERMQSSVENRVFGAGSATMLHCNELLSFRGGGRMRLIIML